MTRRLIRKREEPIEKTKKEDIVENEPMIIDLKVSGEEIASLLEKEEDNEPKIEVIVQEEDVKDLDEKFGVKFEEEIKKVITEVIPDKKPQVNVASLSRAQFRIFQRTGKLPN
jgi:hypothetical protein